MKNLNLFLVAIIVVAFFSIQSCKKTDPEENGDNSETKESILPDNFMIDIPSSISSSDALKNIVGTSDTLQGRQIYKHLRAFIHVGESAARIVNNIMTAISNNNINQAMTVSYTSNDDGRLKNLVVVENSTFENQTFEFQLTISDASYTTNNDEGKALQVFWNRNPVNGIAIIKPLNLNVTHNADYPNAMYKIKYSELPLGSYEKHMIVSISGLPLAAPSVERYSMSTLKMFVGKNGDIIDVYGNSEHPNAWFFHNANNGFDWAFVASSNLASNIAVAEVGLPAITLDSDNRDTLLVVNSIKQVFTDRIYLEYPNINSTDLAAYLTNTNPPGYFNNGGFVQAALAPNNNYSTLQSNIVNLIPYNPSDIKNLLISFK